MARMAHSIEDNPVPQPHYRLPVEPADIPGLVSFWDFQEPAGPRRAVSGEPYVLSEAAGTVAAVETDGNPWGPRAAHLIERQYFSIARLYCSLQYVHGPGGAVSERAWVIQQQKSYR